LGGGAGEAHDELAVSLGAGDVLEQLHRDVCGIEAGENEDVGGVEVDGGSVEFDGDGLAVEERGELVGAEGGDGGGRILVAGTPEQVAKCKTSHTGRFLKSLLENKR
jgi:hypothetical protein